jgi:hypothetical protein
LKLQTTLLLRNPLTDKKNTDKNLVTHKKVTHKKATDKSTDRSTEKKDITRPIPARRCGMTTHHPLDRHPAVTLMNPEALGNTLRRCRKGLKRSITNLGHDTNFNTLSVTADGRYIIFAHD